jgi:hypothetical protein
MTLPDSNFFELFRSIFGNIKTPFNKQRLIDDLMVLLSREEIRKTIADYIDDADRKVLAAVALLCEPAPGELESFFSGELSYAELHNILLNLEERIIIYRFQDDGIRRLALNPALEPVLAPIAAGREILFPSVPEKNLQSAKNGPPENSNGGAAYLQDGRALAGFLAFITGDDDVLKTEGGGIRKKFIDAGKKLFPGLDLELTTGALVQLGLLRADGERFILDENYIEDFGCLSADDGREYWAAAVYLTLNKNEYPVPETPGLSSGYAHGASRGRLRGIASFIHRFRGLIEPGRRYPKITLKRFAELLNHDERGGGWGYRLVENPVQLPFDHLLECLEKTRLLQEVRLLQEDEPDGEAGAFWRTGVFPDTESQEGKAVIAMNSAFSFVLYPEISFADASGLSAFCTIKGSWGTTFELTRASAVKGFDRGFGSDYMLDLLNRLSADRMDANLGWTLKDWEARYSSVTLHEGLILTLAEDRRYLAEAGPVASLIKKTLAPGVYLLGNSEKTTAAFALRKAGVDIIACPEIRASGYQKGSLRSDSLPRPGRSPIRAFSSLDSGASISPFTGTSQQGPKKEPKTQDKPGSIKERLQRRLKEMRLSKGEHDELSARIERRLVLSEAQLEGASVRYEKLEARGLDYVGKAAIAKQAITAAAMVEVSWPGPGGTTNMAVGIPTALEKKGGESVLVIKPVEQGGDQQNGANQSGANQNEALPDLRLPLGKISLLRRIKQSIFGEN